MWDALIESAYKNNNAMNRCCDDKLTAQLNEANVKLDKILEAI